MASCIPVKVLNLIESSKRVNFLAKVIVFCVAIISLVAFAVVESAAIVEAQAGAPRCSYRIDGGERIGELPSDLNSGARLEIDCRMGQTPPQALEVTTELEDPAWIVNGTSQGIEQQIRNEGFVGGIIELDGIVPARRIDIAVTDEQEPYLAEASPPSSIRIISFTGPQFPPSHIEAQMNHPVAMEAQNKLADLEASLGVDQRDAVEPLIERAAQLIDEGRPWAAIDLLDSSQPVLDAYQQNRGGGVGVLLFGLFVGLVIGGLGGALLGWFISRQNSRS